MVGDARNGSLLPRRLCSTMAMPDVKSILIDMEINRFILRRCSQAVERDL